MNKLFAWSVIVLLAVLLAACGAQTVSAPTSTPIPTPLIPVDYLEPGDKIGEMSVVSESIFRHKWLVQLCPIEEDPTSRTRSTDCTLAPLDAVALGMGLSAAESKFQETWDALTWKLEIDGQPLALDAFGWDETPYTDSSGKGVTRGWSVVLKPLTPGTHTVQWTSSSEVATEDWAGSHPPGTDEYIFHITVVQEQQYPPISASAGTGQHAYTSPASGLEFLLYLPGEYGQDTSSKWPLLIYLHGEAAKGTNPDVIRGEPLPKRLEAEAGFPFIVLSPSGNGGLDLWSNDALMGQVVALLDEVQGFFSVDTARIYLTGDGMGGNGAWAIGLRNPERFAALAPIGGYYGYPFTVPENICDLKDVPVWAFHGGQDVMVPIEAEQSLVDALNACGGSAKITVDPKATINIRYGVYAGEELYDWLLTQSRE
jgi:Dienelactone hydrolase family